MSDDSITSATTGTTATTTTATTQTTRVGYIGLDHHHCVPYLQSLAGLPAEVTCACEPTPDFDVDGVDELDDVPIYRDSDELLGEEDVDAVWVTLPNSETPAVVARALTHDVDVFTEKPAARTAADLEPLFESEAASDGQVCVSYPWRAHPVARDIRERAERDFFGDLRSFDARFFASKIEYRDSGHYLFDRAASRGGILQWLGIHWLDLLPWLFDDPVKRVSATTIQDDSTIDVEDGGAVLIETASGAIGSLQAGYYLGADKYDTEVGIVGSDAHCSWDPIGREFGFNGETTLNVERTNGRDSAPRRQITYDYADAPGYGGAWGRAFIERFLRARVDESVPVPVGLSDAHRVLRVLDAIYEAAESDEWVAVDEPGDIVREVSST